MDDARKVLLHNLSGFKVDVKDKKGGQTPLYMAVKSGQIDVARRLIQNGADVDVICYNKPISQLIEETMPALDPANIPRLRSNPSKGSDDPLERMKDLIESSALIDDRNDPTRMKNYSEFRNLVLESDPKEMVILKKLLQ